MIVVLGVCVIAFTVSVVATGTDEKRGEARSWMQFIEDVGKKV